MTDTTIIFDILTPLAALIAVGAGIRQYRDTARKDFIRPIREAQLAVYQKASGAASALANFDRESVDWRSAHNEFLRLYYGPLCIFEDYAETSAHSVQREVRDITVEEAMVAFKICLDAQDFDRLRDLSLGLAHTCRISLGRSWGVNVPQLDGRYQKLIKEYLVRSKERSSL